MSIKRYYEFFCEKCRHIETNEDKDRLPKICPKCGATEIGDKIHG